MVQRVKSWLQIYWFEASQPVVGLFGWLSATWVVGDLFPGFPAWRLSFALLALGLVGYRFLGETLWRGLWTLAEEDEFS